MNDESRTMSSSDDESTEEKQSNEFNYSYNRDSITQWNKFEKLSGNKFVEVIGENNKLWKNPLLSDLKNFQRSNDENTWKGDTGRESARKNKQRMIKQSSKYIQCIMKDHKLG